MRALKTHSNNFPIYYMSVLATVIMLCITSLVFIYLITESLCLLTNFLSPTWSSQVRSFIYEVFFKIRF